MSSTETVPERIDRSVIWKRGAFMLLFIFAFGGGQSLLFLLAFIQFVWLMSTGESNARLARFGKSLSMWLAGAGQFLICATEEKPFPWADWPVTE